jgi:hypothetical protein
MIARHPLTQISLELPVVTQILLGDAEPHAVAVHGDIAAIVQPGRTETGVEQEAKQPGVVIAEEMHSAKSLRPIADQQVDHPSALRPAIHVIAEVDDESVGTRSEARRVRGNQVMHLLQKIGTTVNVADRVHAEARRYPRPLASDRRHSRQTLGGAPEQAAEKPAARPS